MPPVNEYTVTVFGEQCSFQAIDGRWWLLVNGSRHRLLSDAEAAFAIWGAESEKCHFVLATAGGSAPCCGEGEAHNVVTESPIKLAVENRSARLV